MAARGRRPDPATVQRARARWERGGTDPVDVRVLVKESLALLSRRAPGNAVEVRVPPYGAVQVVGGATHRRGTPPAVVETDPLTWLALAHGHREWREALALGDVVASGERSDLSDLLPLTD